MPVLSKSTTSALLNFSSIAPPLITAPLLVARDIPATSAIGTAKINGHGVATTNTATVRVASPLNKYVIKAMKIVIGTNLKAHLFAKRIFGEDSAREFLTIVTIPE